MNDDRVSLSPLRPEDSSAFLRWINDRELVLLNSEFSPVDGDEHTAWFSTIQHRDDVRIFGIRELATDRLIGSCQLLSIDVRRRTAELQIRIGEADARGFGLGTEAIRKLCAFGFDELGLRRIGLKVFSTNSPARRAYEKAGFQWEGVLRSAAVIDGAPVDVIVMSLLADDEIGADHTDEADFTLDHYAEVVARAAEIYRFEPFGTTTPLQHVLWRHDVDMSMHRAVRLAEIERRAGVRATYFLHTSSSFYNLLEPAIAALARELVDLGHWIGVHIDGGDADGLERRVASESRIVEYVTGTSVAAFSFHNPGPAELALEADDVSGLINAYGPGLRNNYEYVSDSNGYWRNERLFDVINATSAERLHVLTHPEWWQDSAMAPRRRVARCVAGRAQRTLDNYDALLLRHKRRNIR